MDLFCTGLQYDVFDSFLEELHTFPNGGNECGSDKLTFAVVVSVVLAIPNWCLYCCS